MVGAMRSAEFQACDSMNDVPYGMGALMFYSRRSEENSHEMQESYTFSVVCVSNYAHHEFLGGWSREVH